MNIISAFTLFKQDIYRKLLLENKSTHLGNVFLCLWNRGVISVLIYRLKRYLYLKESKPLRLIIWLLKFAEFHICHSEIDPRAQIAGGFVLSSMGGVSLSYAIIIGENCTFMGKATPTLGAMEDIQASDRIIIGSHCVLGHNVKIINPVSIANGVQIKANSVVFSSIKKEAVVVSGFPAKIIASHTMADAAAWNPLQGNYGLTTVI